MKNPKRYFSLVKFSHTLFAMPFALIGFFMAVTLTPHPFRWSLLGLVVLSMVFARNSAMAFNRFLDRDIDAQNPRTSGREIPAGAISPRKALLFVLLNSAAFVATTSLINPLVLALSPVALLVILGYSYTKRFTPLCHFVLGAGLALAPLGAYLAVTSQFDWLPALLAASVFFWVSGFDIIYALQDEEFDKQKHLHSIPVLLGKAGALRLSRGLHLLSASLLALSATLGGLGWAYWVGVSLFALLLVYQQSLVRPDDLSRVDLAFFTTNGVASVLFAVMAISDLYL